MLVELRIRDLAVIRDISVELGPGLNVLSGETGAGKSILVGALSLLLGERASSDSVRTGADRAVVEAVFDVADHPELKARLDEAGLPDEGDHLILRREVQAAGRNRAWINGSPATAGTVGTFGRALVDLHGQHDHQTLLRLDEQRSILDAFAEARELAEAVREAHDNVTRLRALKAEQEARARELEAQRDFVQFQAREIDEAEIEPESDESLESELARLNHAEELATGSEAVHRSLYAEDGAVSEVLAAARDRVKKLARTDPDLEDLVELLDSSYHQVVEAGRRAGDYASGVEVDPNRAERVRRRLNVLSGLRRKYGPELTDILTFRTELADRLTELDDVQESAGVTARELDDARTELASVATRLSEVREGAARRFADAVLEVLPELGMAGARFEVALTLREEPGAFGAEDVEYRASLNPGFDPRPLAEIASGGELARVMLALKSILAQVDRVPTLIFDEVDAGVGGEVAHGVARKLARVSEHHQVLVITHLAQVASRGHTHLRVEKGEEDGRATTRIRRLDGEERILEISRMLGGDPGSETSRKHADEMLSRAVEVSP